MQLQQIKFIFFFIFFIQSSKKANFHNKNKSVNFQLLEKLVPSQKQCRDFRSLKMSEFWAPLCRKSCIAPLSYIYIRVIYEYCITDLNPSSRVLSTLSFRKIPLNGSCIANIAIIYLSYDDRIFLASLTSFAVPTSWIAPGIDTSRGVICTVQFLFLQINFRWGSSFFDSFFEVTALVPHFLVLTRFITCKNRILISNCQMNRLP